jgi:hypothetical protein
MAALQISCVPRAAEANQETRNPAVCMPKD